MVILAALPGMARDLLVTGKLVHPGNFEKPVNSLGSQLRKVGLAVGSGYPAASRGDGNTTIASRTTLRMTLSPLLKSRHRSVQGHGPDHRTAPGGLRSCQTALLARTGGREVAVVDVQYRLPLAADLLPDDDVLA